MNRIGDPARSNDECSELKTNRGSNCYLEIATRDRETQTLLMTMEQISLFAGGQIISWLLAHI